jgi:hypothetical protein
MKRNGVCGLMHVSVLCLVVFIEEKQKQKQNAVFCVFKYV